jgi:NAD(P)-dependent dehydrogenase (short-subunit alcohol dehydrogenase family)
MSEKIAVITGTSSGFGLLTTLELAKRGFHVVATMRDLGRRTALDQAASAAGVAAKIDIRRLDITEIASIPAAVDGIRRDYPRIDVLVNNAGFAVAGFAEDVTLDELRLQFETNFFGTVALTRAVLPIMRAQHSGHIIMLSSVGGLHGSPVIGSYSASKHALEGWSETLRLEVRSLGIRVVLIEPGAFATDIWTRGAHLGKAVGDASSPNLARSRRMQDHVRTLPKRDPIEVARLIARIAQDPNPRLRYLVGTDAHIQMWLKRTLPWKWHEKLVARALKLD